jgi:hypothetical protein
MLSHFSELSHSLCYSTQSFLTALVLSHSSLVQCSAISCYSELNYFATVLIYYIILHRGRATLSGWQVARSRVHGQEVAHGSSAWGARLGRARARTSVERRLVCGVTPGSVEPWLAGPGDKPTGPPP